MSRRRSDGRKWKKKEEKKGTNQKRYKPKVVLLLLLHFNFICHLLFVFNETRKFFFLMGALFNAAKFGLVRNSGLDVNQRGPSQWTALHQACFNGHTEIVKLLLAHPNIEVKVRDPLQRTPLSSACFEGHLSIVKLLLLDPRVDATLPDLNGCTPLWMASSTGSHEVIESLIASGKDLGDLNKKGTWSVDGKDFHQLRPAPTDTSSKADPANIATIRFFAIAVKLPMDLQMVLCHRVVGSMKQNITSTDSEGAFKSLAARMSAPTPPSVTTHTQSTHQRVLSSCSIC